MENGNQPETEKKGTGSRAVKKVIRAAFICLLVFAFVKSGLARAAYITFFPPIRVDRAVRRINDWADFEKYAEMDVWSYMRGDEEEEAEEEAEPDVRTEPDDEDHNVGMLTAETGIETEDDRAAFLEKLSGCMPYIGMDGQYVDQTVVGPHNYEEIPDGKIYDIGYVWRLGPERDDLVLTVGCKDGKVNFIRRWHQYYSDPVYWDDAGMPLFTREETAEWYTEEEIRQKINEAKYDPEVQKYDTAEAYAEDHAAEYAEILRSENEYRYRQDLSRARDRQMDDYMENADEEESLDYYMEYDKMSESEILEKAWRHACDYWRKHHIENRED